MIRRVMALAHSGSRLLARAQKRVRRIIRPAALANAALAFAATVVFIWTLHSVSTVVVTHDQARTYAGILAQVIPVLLLALYVESSAQWGTRRAELADDRASLDELSKEVQSRVAESDKAREQLDSVGKEDANPEMLTMIDEADLTISDLKSKVEHLTSGVEHLTLSLRQRTGREGVRAGTEALQLLVGVLGEMLALSSVLAPSRQIVSATDAVILLLFLFGTRLLEWPLTVDKGRAVVGRSFGGFVVLALVVAAGVAWTFKITVTG